MIRKQDIRDRAAEWHLRPEVVEKDYVLGWLLAGLAGSSTRDTWIFKGGTSIKKCYIETYRFSEDLDFSLLPGAGYTEEDIRQTLLSITRRAGDLSAIQFPENLVEVRARKNHQGQPTFQGRISYGGPLAYPGPPRVLFDITQHEPVLEAPDARPIFHPYPDPLPEGTVVLVYSLNELLAEKTRALYERSRPRDLYDVVFLLENRADAFDLAKVRHLFGEKCRVKGLQVPRAAKLLESVTAADELRSEWVNMLSNQLPSLPSLDDLLQRLPTLLAWMDGPEMALREAVLASVPVPPNMAQIAPAGIQYWGGGLPLESVRFAGANRLMIEFDYDGKRRVAEPYSLRQAGTGNVLLYAWEQGSTQIKAFNTAKMQNVRPTNQRFVPRYRVEFSSMQPLRIPPLAGVTLRPPRPGLTPKRSSRPRKSSYGPSYVFECVYCQKRFTHTSNNPTLRRHQSKGGYGNCPGRRGYLQEIR